MTVAVDGTEAPPAGMYEGWKAGDPMVGLAESLHDAIGHIEVELHANDSVPLKAAKWRIEDAIRKLEAGEAFGPTLPVTRDAG